MSQRASNLPNHIACEIRRITADETLPLRSDILRPGRPLEAAKFAGDEADSTVHLGASVEGTVVGIASLFRAEMPGQPGADALQLRGMATAEGIRGGGVGRALVLACFDSARNSGVALLWCNARTSAVGFYLKCGFTVVGNEFDIPDVGPHFRMFVRLHAPN
jgi:GNAT superfamily N-acetyltransferase